MANAITLLRIVLSICIIFVRPLTLHFYILYTVAGISDMIDGVVARRTNSVSERGARLDSAADFIFFTVCAVKLFPLVILPVWLWIWIAAIGVLKIVIMTKTALRHNLASEHCAANKITGLTLFILPFFMKLFDIKLAIVFICMTASPFLVRKKCELLKIH